MKVPFPYQARFVPEFTTVVGIDHEHLREFKLVWPTWRCYRPELISHPLLLICDAAVSEREWNAKLSFIDHPNKRLVLWSMNGVDQREKMLSAFVFVPGHEVHTPWYLKLDTDTVAAKSGPWLKTEWFASDDHGRLPVFVSARLNFRDRPALLAQLDAWGDTVPHLAKFRRLAQLPEPERIAIQKTRVISWCFFGNTAWTRTIAGYCGNGRMPIPSQDTFLWYCAARRGDFFRRVKMRPHFQHIFRHSERLAKVTQKLTSASPSPMM
jgi:hypothetical protein